MTATFRELGVSAELADALEDRGITEAFAIQELTVADALAGHDVCGKAKTCLLYTSPSPRDQRGSRMPSSA